MSEYRNEAGQIAEDSRWTFFRFLPLLVIIAVVLFAIGFGLKSIGLIGGTAVERIVFEESYQRSESLKSRIATDEAVIIEIQGKLSNPNLDENIRYNLNAQISAAKIRISTARGQQ